MKRRLVLEALAAIGGSASLLPQSLIAQTAPPANPPPPKDANPKSTPTDANGISADTILLGQSCAQSGPAADLGIEMRWGAELCFEQVNSKPGGIAGRKIKLISLDDGYEPERAKANTLQLVENEKVFSLFGYVGTPTSIASLSVFADDKLPKVPFVGAFTGAEALRTPFNRQIFNVRASYYDETEHIIQHLTSLGMRKIGVLYQNDSYGQAGLSGVKRAMEKRKLPIAAEATVERNTTMVLPAVGTLMAANPDAIVMISAYKTIAAFVRAAKETGYLGQFYNVSFVGSYSLARELGKDGYGVMISQVVPSPLSVLPIVREYNGLLEEKRKAEPSFKGTPSFTSLEGFISAKVLVEGIIRGGKNLTRDKLIEGLESISYFDFGGFGVHFSPNIHGGSKFVEMTMIGNKQNFIY